MSTSDPHEPFGGELSADRRAAALNRRLGCQKFRIFKIGQRGRSGVLRVWVGRPDLLIVTTAIAGNWPPSLADGSINDEISSTFAARNTPGRILATALCYQVTNQRRPSTSSGHFVGLAHFSECLQLKELLEWLLPCVVKKARDRLGAIQLPRGHGLAVVLEKGAHLVVFTPNGDHLCDALKTILTFPPDLRTVQQRAHQLGDIRAPRCFAEVYPVPKGERSQGLGKAALGWHRRAKHQGRDDVQVQFERRFQFEPNVVLLPIKERHIPPRTHHGNERRASFHLPPDGTCQRK